MEISLDVFLTADGTAESKWSFMHANEQLIIHFFFRQ
jgi:hypothetical protein